MRKSTIVIVGAGGMGVTIAHRLGADHTVILADFNAAQLDSVGRQMTDEGFSVVTHPLDVSDRHSVSELARLSVTFGPVASVVHTAGISPGQGSADDVFRVDLLGVAFVLDAFGDIVEEGAAGVIISSMAGHMVSVSASLEQHFLHAPSEELLNHPELAAGRTDSGFAYTLSKKADQLLVQRASQSWGRRGARINSISPGIISTPMGRGGLDDPEQDGMRAMIASAAVKRAGTADEIASAAEFLLGPSARFITGTDLLIDGGVVASLRSSNVVASGVD